MRINKVQLAGLAVALVGATTQGASAEDVTISTSTTTPLTTSDPNPTAPVSPGDITVANNGTITVTAGQTAITVDSSNDVTVADGGSLVSNDANNTTAILLLGGNSGAISLDGDIRLLESYTITDADNDGDLDGLFATGTNRTGILLNGGTFTGDIDLGGNINIEGQNSAGIRIQSLLDGSLTTTGVISVVGDNSVGVAITGGAANGVTGDVIVGGVSVTGQNSVGLLVGAPIGGELRIRGNWSSNAYHTTQPPSNVSNFDADDYLQAGSAVVINYSVAGGVSVDGIGVEDDLDDDYDGLDDNGDGTNDDTNDDVSSTVTTYGSAPALLIQADPSANLVLGGLTQGVAIGYGLQVRGSVSAFGVYDGFSATAIRIQGDGGGSTVNTSAGVAIDGNVLAGASEANSYGLYIGDNAIVPNVLIREALTSSSAGDLGSTGYGVFIASGATVASLENTGIVVANFFGETGDAVAIVDQSNTLATITNSGSISGQIIQTDDDISDDVPPPPVTGSIVAIDVSASTIDVTLTQEPDTVFNEDDADDDDTSTRPDVEIVGDILFGSGNDTFNLLAGTAEGALSFGAGTDTFLIDGGGVYSGVLTDTDGLLTINVVDGTLSHGGGQLDLTTATFGADAILGVTISETPGAGTLFESSGTITFAAGSVIVPTVPIGLPASGTHTFLTANGGLIGAANVVGAVTGVGSPFLYNLDIDVVTGDANSLEASYIMKTATELGLTTNQTSAFSSLIDSLRLNDEAAAALSALATEEDFFDAYEDLMPSYSSAAAEIATTAIQQMQGATGNRMAATRLQGLNEVSVWAQEIGYGITRTPPTDNGQEFTGAGFGLAFGIDGPLDNGNLFGLSASFLASEVEEEGRPQGEISAWFGQVNAYLGTARGPIDLDFIAGIGAGKIQSRRFIEIGDDFSALAEADWWAFEGHASARASAPMALTDWFIVTPQAALTYVALQESGYTEEGGGIGINYDVDAAFSQRLWADVGVEFSTRWGLSGQGVISPRVFVGYRANVLDEAGERTMRFVDAGSDFTLVDDAFGSGGALVGIGFDATNGYSTFSLGYEGEFSDQVERHSLNAAIRFRF